MNSILFDNKFYDKYKSLSTDKFSSLDLVYDSLIKEKERYKNPIADKKYLPANKEWVNSKYIYNKTKGKTTPVADKVAYQLIKSYFNLSLLKKR